MKYRLKNIVTIVNLAIIKSGSVTEMSSMQKSAIKFRISLSQTLEETHSQTETSAKQKKQKKIN